MIALCVVAVTCLLVGVILGVVLGVRRMPSTLAEMTPAQLHELAGRVEEKRR